MKMAARRIERVAETVIEKAKNIYQTVEELTQLQTGRMRTLVKGTCHLKGAQGGAEGGRGFQSGRGEKFTSDKENIFMPMPASTKGGGQCMGMPDVCKTPGAARAADSGSLSEHRHGAAGDEDGDKGEVQQQGSDSGKFGDSDVAR